MDEGQATLFNVGIRLVEEGSPKLKMIRRLRTEVAITSANITTPSGASSNCFLISSMLRLNLLYPTPNS